MEQKGNRNGSQLVTLDDLQTFKAELLAALKSVYGGKSAEKKWLKSKDVRKILGISPGTLQTMRSYGHIPFMRIGGVIYYDQAEIETMLANAKVDRNQNR